MATELLETDYGPIRSLRVPRTAPARAALERRIQRNHRRHAARAKWETYLDESTMQICMTCARAAVRRLIPVGWEVSRPRPRRRR